MSTCVRLKVACVALVAVVALGAAPAAAQSPAPEGPRLATVQLSAQPGGRAGEARFRLTLATVGLQGGDRRVVLGGPLGGRGLIPVPFAPPAWSADGSALAFSGGRSRGQASIYTVAAGGGPARIMSGTRGAMDPVLSPDGRKLAFSRVRVRLGKAPRKAPRAPRPIVYSSTTTWVRDLESGELRRLTRWRNGLVHRPSSFSPDGSHLALTRYRGGEEPRAMSLDLASGAMRIIALGAQEPVFSPRGDRVALISFVDGIAVQTGEGPYPVGELYVAAADGTEPRRLSFARGHAESNPSWDPSGERLAFNRIAIPRTFGGLDQLFPFGNSIAQVNADGSCPQEIFSLRREALYGAAWRPGSGREAGRITC